MLSKSPGEIRHIDRLSHLGSVAIPGQVSILKLVTASSRLLWIVKKHKSWWKSNDARLHSMLCETNNSTCIPSMPWIAIGLSLEDMIIILLLPVRQSIFSNISAILAWSPAVLLTRSDQHILPMLPIPVQPSNGHNLEMLYHCAVVWDLLRMLTWDHESAKFW